MVVWLGILAAVGAVASGIAAQVFLFVHAERRRNRERVAGDQLLSAAGVLLGAQFCPAAPRRRTGYRAPFGTLQGTAEGLSYTVTIHDRRTEDVGHAGCISVQPPAGADFTVELAATRVAPVRPGVTLADLLGRRRAGRIAHSANEPLLRMAAVSADFAIAEHRLTAHSRPSVWQWSDHAEPAPLADFTRVVLAAARQLCRFG